MTTFPSSLLRGWWAALLLAAAACLTPGRASAECGDYVTIRNGPADPAHHATTRDATPQPDQAPARPPCHGPNCSSAPARDPSPLPPVAPTGLQPKELTQHPAAAADPDAGPGSALDRDPSSARPVRRASSVFHPPRAG